MSLQEAWPEPTQDGNACKANAWGGFKPIWEVPCMVQGDTPTCSKVQVHSCLSTVSIARTRDWMGCVCVPPTPRCTFLLPDASTMIPNSQHSDPTSVSPLLLFNMRVVHHGFHAPLYCGDVLLRNAGSGVGRLRTMGLRMDAAPSATPGASCNLPPVAIVSTSPSSLRTPIRTRMHPQNAAMVAMMDVTTTWRQGPGR